MESRWVGSKRMSEERLEGLGESIRVAFPPPNPIIVELNNELLEERKRHDATNECMRAIVLDLAMDVAKEKSLGEHHTHYHQDSP